VTGGYTTPFTISFPIRDRTSCNGLYLFTDEENSHFMYAPPPWSTGPGQPYALYQYGDFLSGAALSLTGIGFPFTGNAPSPSPAPLAQLQHYSAGSAWNGLFATDATGNFYVPAAGGVLQVYHPDGTHVNYSWSPSGAVLQILWSPSGHLYTVERTLSGSTFQDKIGKYTPAGQSVGIWYVQANALPQPPVNNPPLPGLLLDVGNTGNIYGVDLSNMTIFGRAGSPYAAIFATSLPGDALPSRAFCLCEALGYLAVLGCESGNTVNVAALGADGGLSVWDTAPPYNACALYLFDLTSGMPITPSWGPALPFTISASPEYNGLLFDGVSTLLVVDKFNGAAPPGGVQQLAACIDAYGTLHVAYPLNGNIMYANANPPTAALSTPVTVGVGAKPSIRMSLNRPRIAYDDSSGNLQIRYWSGTAIVTT
jgi:hypothetical protein